MNWAEQWAETIVQSIRELGTTLGGFLPNLAGMLLILLVGYFVSKIAGRVAGTLLGRLGFNTAAETIGLSRALQKAGIATPASAMVGRLVFWFFMLTFLVSAADALGLANVSGTIDSFVTYLPNVIAAMVIVIAGLLAANWIKVRVADAAANLGLDYANALASVVYAALVVLVASVAIGQLRIQMDLINQIIQIVLVAAGAGLALTLGLGTRDIAKHLVAGTYARDTFEPGMHIQIGNIEGTLEQVGTVSSRVRSADGRVAFIPNASLIDQVVTGKEAA